ncbi:MAG: ABC transporter permease [Sulfobacillus sp.]
MATPLMELSPTPDSTTRSPGRASYRFLMVIWRNPKGRIGLLMLLAFFLMALFAGLIAPDNPSATIYPPSLGPSLQHLMGTTGTGQDVFSQFVWGAQASLGVALGAGILTTLFGLVMGLFAGFLSGWMDDVLSLITNVFLVIPALPLMVVLAAYINIQGIFPIILVITVTSWAWGARVLRSQVVSIRNRDYILAARLSADSTWRIVWHEVFPNIISLVSASFLNAAVSAVLAASGLEFLGLGDPSVISWGTMLYWANNNNALLNGQWIWVLAPGLAIALLGTAFVLINFGIDEITNPRLRKEG